MPCRPSGVSISLLPLASDPCFFPFPSPQFKRRRVLPPLPSPLVPVVPSRPSPSAPSHSPPLFPTCRSSLEWSLPTGTPSPLLRTLARRPFPPPTVVKPAWQVPPLRAYPGVLPKLHECLCRPPLHASSVGPLATTAPLRGGGAR
jgi:hypothetical protein